MPEAASINDPLMYGVELPLRACLYPLGFPLRVGSNSPLVLRAAEESWSRFRQTSPTPAAEVRIIISGEGSPPNPAFRAQEHLLTIVSDGGNFAVCDLAKGFGACWLTHQVAADRAWMRFHFLEAMVYMILSHQHLAPIHAGCVAFQGRGVLLCGLSGSGKSSLAFACARHGWTYLGDDAACLIRKGDGRTVLGKPHQMRFRETAGDLLPELKGLLAAPSPNGKMTIEIQTSDLPGIATAFEASVAYVVFLNRHGSGPAELAQLSREEAFRRLASDIPLYQLQVYDEQIATLHKLLEAEAFELRYRDLESAVRRLELLMQRGKGA